MSYKQITSFEIACEKMGISTNLPDVSSWPASLRRSMIALYKLTVIRDAIVGAWKADWDNSNQKKWFCWFWMNKAGFRLYGVYYGYDVTATTSGARLCYETEEQARFAGTTFLSLYEEMMTEMPVIDQQEPVLTPVRAEAAKSFTKEQAIELALKIAGDKKVNILEEARKIYEWMAA